MVKIFVFLSFFMSLYSLGSAAQNAEGEAVADVSAQQSSVYEGKFENKEFGINLVLNLYEEVIEVPGLELETCYGYFDGRINGKWLILKVKQMSEKYAVARVVSERGADAIDMKFIYSEGNIILEPEDANVMKGVKDRKYVKLPKKLLFTVKN